MRERERERKALLRLRTTKEEETVKVLTVCFSYILETKLEKFDEIKPLQVYATFWWEEVRKYLSRVS